MDRPSHFLVRSYLHLSGCDDLILEPLQGQLFQRHQKGCDTNCDKVILRCSARHSCGDISLFATVGVIAKAGYDTCLLFAQRDQVCDEWSVHTVSCRPGRRLGHLLPAWLDRLGSDDSEPATNSRSGLRAYRKLRADLLDGRKTKQHAGSSRRADECACRGT